MAIDLQLRAGGGAGSDDRLRGTAQDGLAAVSRAPEAVPCARRGKAGPAPRLRSKRSWGKGRSHTATREVPFRTTSLGLGPPAWAGLEVQASFLSHPARGGRAGSAQRGAFTFGKAHDVGEHIPLEFSAPGRESRDAGGKRANPQVAEAGSWPRVLGPARSGIGREQASAGRDGEEVLENPDGSPPEDRHDVAGAARRWAFLHSWLLGARVPLGWAGGFSHQLEADG